MWKFLRRTKLSVLLLAAVILLIFLHYISVLSFIEDRLIKLLSPINASIYSVGAKFNDLYSSRFNIGQIKSENEKMKESLAALSLENAELRLKIKENEEQASQCQFVSETKLDAIGARIIGKNPEPNMQSIIIDKGSNDGLVVGSPVISDKGVIVGKINAVKSMSAEAILINDSRSQIAALILNQSFSKGVVSGEHGLSLKMELVPLNETVKEGDIITTSGIEPLVPRGLVVGKVNRIVADPNTFFQTIYIQSLVKLDNLTVVSVIKGRKND